MVKGINTLLLSPFAPDYDRYTISKYGRRIGNSLLLFFGRFVVIILLALTAMVTTRDIDIGFMTIFREDRNLRLGACAQSRNIFAMCPNEQNCHKEREDYQRNIVICSG